MRRTARWCSSLHGCNQCPGSEELQPGLACFRIHESSGCVGAVVVVVVAGVGLGAADAGATRSAVSVRSVSRPANVAAVMPPVSASSARLAAAAPTVGGAPPNIVFVLTDDLPWNLVRYMPNVAKLQAAGTEFSQYFVTDSLCCPSRASIFTGEFPHNTGVFTNTRAGRRLHRVPDAAGTSRTSRSRSRQSATETAMMGKYLNGYEPREGKRAPSRVDRVGRGRQRLSGVQLRPQPGRPGGSLRQGSRRLPDRRAGRDRADVHRQSAAAATPFFIEIATFAPHAPYMPAPRDAAARTPT